MKTELHLLRQIVTNLINQKLINQNLINQKLLKQTEFLREGKTKTLFAFLRKKSKVLPITLLCARFLIYRGKYSKAKPNVLQYLKLFSIVKHSKYNLYSKNRNQ